MHISFGKFCHPPQGFLQVLLLGELHTSRVRQPRSCHLTGDTQSVCHYLSSKLAVAMLIFCITTACTLVWQGLSVKTSQGSLLARLGLTYAFVHKHGCTHRSRPCTCHTTLMVAFHITKSQVIQHHVMVTCCVCFHNTDTHKVTRHRHEGRASQAPL